MGKQQLYINGTAVDMPKDEIKIKVESNIFSDADKIKTAHSYNIALPRTMTNDSIFALAYVPSAETGGRTTHTYLKASLYMDGVPLFVDGQAVLNNVDEKGYNLNLFWGLLNIFDTIKEEGLDLCDLPMSKYWDEDTMGTWAKVNMYDYGNNMPQYSSGMTQAIYNNLNEDSQLQVLFHSWILPSVRADVMLRNVLSVYGVNFRLTADAAERTSRLWFPLTTLKPLAKDEQVTINALVVPYYMGGGKYTPNFKDTTPDPDHPGNMIFVPLHTEIPSQLDYSATNSFAANAVMTIEHGHEYENVGSLQADANIHVKNVRVFGSLPYPITIEIPKLDNRQIPWGVEGGRFVYNTEIKDDFSCNWNEVVFQLKDEWQDPPTTAGSGTLNIQFTVTDADYMSSSRWWNFQRNYPEIGVIDFLSELLAHIGGCIVGSVAKPNALKICTFDEICEADPIVLDEYGIEKISMTLEDLAQKNVYTHDENNDVDTQYTAEGVIYTNDETLKLERTAFASKFKVPVQNNVLLWNVNDNVATWNGSANYIAGLDDNNYIYDTGQNFAETISNYYTNYEKIVNHPKEIEVVVRLSVLDLLNFDMARPVYIKQLGRKYLIKSLESDSGEKYKLTLVQI